MKGLVSFFRKSYFKFLGLSIQQGGSLGRISCEWPHKVRIGRDCTIQDEVDFRIGHPFSENNSIVIGDRVLIGRCCEFNSSNKIIIGNDCLIASNTSIVDVGHSTELHCPMNTQPVLNKEIVIGDDVWIGTRCIILQGVSIGKGSIVGAGSLVNKSIPDYQIWAGSPARFIRNR